MATIKKLILRNFKRFKSLELDFSNDINVLIGGNEAGKSSVLQAIDLVLSASRSKIESAGLENLLNAETIAAFMRSARRIEDLPEMLVEIYLDDIQGRFDLDGRNNTYGRDHIGIKLTCKPMDEYTKDISTILSDAHDSFPFEYYSIHFQTFTDEAIFHYRKPVRHLLIDSSQINNEYATREYTRAMYAAHASASERNHHSFEYRKSKSRFTESVLKSLNDTLPKYQFDLRTSQKSNVETDIILTEADIPVDSKGKGRQCFIKTEFALRNEGQGLDLLLLEEPENHLSNVHMRQLIDRIRSSTKKQLIIATHSSFIATRLDLQNVIILSEEYPSRPATLKHLSNETAKFFMKAPDNNVLELALCKKAILLEGDAEFILMDALYKNCTDGISPDEDGVHIISIDGTSFKRYLELAKILGIKVAAIRDNDSDFQTNCVANYENYTTESINIFADTDNNRSTFEVCMYQDNREKCETLFSEGRKKLTVQDFMLKNKTDAAFQLLCAHGASLAVPDYIQKAITWIRA
ncbi:ATP-dependent nuclease [Brucella pseudintermedia]|uniref:ATP-dependent nuclease n=1 Tax=Brucella pseudintermedia TaxID=370111 RepID=UPI00124EB1E5|nr:AAA family ATPase [Brucella pseudintermedia]KAB2684758.1 AAA family ATPase [Brucella pseudintermedia]